MRSFFGEWDAPATDDLPHVDTPVGSVCFQCEEPIREGDGGGTYESGLVVHKECNLRSVMGGIGHLVDHARYCATDTDAGLGRRVSSKMVWEWFVEGRRYSVAEIEAMRDGVYL